VSFGIADGTGRVRWSTVWWEPAARARAALDRSDGRNGSHGPGAGSCVRAPPTPPYTDCAMGLLVPVASNPTRFSKPVPFSGRAGRIFPLRTAPFLSDQRVPGRKFIIADTDHTRSILGCIRPVNIHRCLEAIQLPIVAAEKFATDPGHQPHDCPRHAGLPLDRLTPAEKGKIRSHPDFCTNVALQR
jgi:hypothetical protein